MMDADNDRSAAFVILHDAQLPKRPRLVQGFGSEIGDVALQLDLIGLARKAHAPDVPRSFEMGVVDPPQLACAALDMLLETGDCQEALGDGFLKLIEIDRPLKYKDADDNHRIRRPVHPEPGRIHG